MSPEHCMENTRRGEAAGEKTNKQNSGLALIVSTFVFNLKLYYDIYCEASSNILFLWQRQRV